MRSSIKNYEPEILTAYEALVRAVNFHNSGQSKLAAKSFREADIKTIFDWHHPLSLKPFLNVVNERPDDFLEVLPKADRDPVREANPALKERLLSRDGYRCRYCGCPVVRAEVRKEATRLYPDDVPWNHKHDRDCHAGFLAFWAQFDHVIPHCRGGRTNEENMVVSCYLCNFGKDQYLLSQIGLVDPRDTPPIAVEWDGLELLLSGDGKQVIWPRRARRKQRAMIEVRNEFFGTKESVKTIQQESCNDDLLTVFLEGAWIGKGYVFTPQIAGKERYFLLNPELCAEEVVRNDLKGCIIKVSAETLRKRKIALTDVEVL